MEALASVHFDLFVKWDSTGDAVFFKITATDKPSALRKFLRARLEDLEMVLDDDRTPWTPQATDIVSEEDDLQITADELAQTTDVLQQMKVALVDNSQNETFVQTTERILEPLSQLSKRLQWYLLSNLFDHCEELHCWSLQDARESEEIE